MSDIEDLFLPSPTDLLVNLEESRDIVDMLLERLPGMYEERAKSMSGRVKISLQVVLKDSLILLSAVPFVGLV